MMIPCSERHANEMMLQHPGVIPGVHPRILGMMKIYSPGNLLRYWSYPAAARGMIVML